MNIGCHNRSAVEEVDVLPSKNQVLRIYHYVKLYYRSGHGAIVMNTQRHHEESRIGTDC